jgi:hypothetical protein
MTGKKQLLVYEMISGIHDVIYELLQYTKDLKPKKSCGHDNCVDCEKINTMEIMEAAKYLFTAHRFLTHVKTELNPDCCKSVVFVNDVRYIHPLILKSNKIYSHIELVEYIRDQVFDALKSVNFLRATEPWFIDKLSDNYMIHCFGDLVRARDWLDVEIKNNQQSKLKSKRMNDICSRLKLKRIHKDVLPWQDKSSSSHILWEAELSASESKNYTASELQDPDALTLIIRLGFCTTREEADVIFNLISIEL